jgi:uncharacterized protein YndB with AHSA1/START domain
METVAKTNTRDRELVMTRIINAPRDLVFKVWTEPKHMAKWWGPNGFTNTIHAMDVKPGGSIDFIMHGPDGTDYPNYIFYKEVVRPSKLSFLHGSKPNDPGSFNVTVTFKELGQKTEITMHMVFNTQEEKDIVVEKYGAIEGNKQTMDRLESYLSNLK